MTCESPIPINLLGSLVQGPPGELKSNNAILSFEKIEEATEAAKTLPTKQYVFVEKDSTKNNRGTKYRVNKGLLVFKGYQHPYVDIYDYHDGGDDFTAAELAASATGAEVRFPEGTFTISDRVVKADEQLLWRGAGRFKTIIKLLDNKNSHLVAFANNSKDSEIHSLTLDQNRDNQTSGHTLRLGGVKGLKMSDFRVVNAVGYGIGVQAGANKNVTMSQFEVDNTGDDAIDIKDLERGNFEVVMSDITLRNFGNIGTNKPGIDVRGPATITNVNGVMSNQNDRGLLRLRADGPQGRHGQGTFIGIRAEAESGTDCRALWIEDGVTNYTILGVTIRGGSLGTISGVGGILSSLHMIDSVSNKEALSLFCKDTQISQVTIDGCTRAVDFEAGATGNRLTGIYASNVSGADAIRFNNTADNNSIVGGSIPAGKTISDAAINTTIRDIANWKTAANLLSSTFLVDSQGTRIVTIPHGLAVTPKPEDINITLSIPPGGPTDWRPVLVQLDGNPSSTNITARVVIGTASATPGAVARLSIQVRAKNS